MPSRSSLSEAPKPYASIAFKRTLHRCTHYLFSSWKNRSDAEKSFVGNDERLKVNHTGYESLVHKKSLNWLCNQKRAPMPRLRHMCVSWAARRSFPRSVTNISPLRSPYSFIVLVRKCVSAHAFSTSATKSGSVTFGMKRCFHTRPPSNIQVVLVTIVDSGRWIRGQSKVRVEWGGGCIIQKFYVLQMAP